jgi:hypothetical protein
MAIPEPLCGTTESPVAASLGSFQSPIALYYDARGSQE